MLFVNEAESHCVVLSLASSTTELCMDLHGNGEAKTIDCHDEPAKVNNEPFLHFGTVFLTALRMKK